MAQRAKQAKLKAAADESWQKPPALVALPKWKPKLGDFPYETVAQRNYNLNLISMLKHLGLREGFLIEAYLFEGASHVASPAYSRPLDGSTLYAGRSHIIARHLRTMGDCLETAWHTTADSKTLEVHDSNPRIAPDALYDLQVRVGDSMVPVIKYYGDDMEEVMRIPRRLLHEETSAVPGTLIAMQKADDNRVYLGTFESKDRDEGVAITGATKFTHFSRKPQSLGLIALEPEHVGDFYVVKRVSGIA